MEYFLFVFYLFLLGWLVTKTRFFLKTGLSKSQLLIFFLVKIIVGIFYGWVGAFYAQTGGTGDTWTFHYFGIVEYKLLWQHPMEYLTNIFNNPYPGGLLNFFGDNNSYWNDLKANVFSKLLSIFDIFGFGNYYINLVFFSFLSLFAPIATYRVMTDIFKNQKVPLLVACFLLPSFLYWTSGLHKDGLLALGVSLILYHLYFGFKQKSLTFARWAGIACGLVMLLLLRNFLLVIIIPAMCAWFLADRFPRHQMKSFLAVYLLFSILFFGLRHVDTRFDFPQAVVNKQHAFEKIVGYSSIPIRQLNPHLSSFILSTPQAITLSSLRPYPNDIKNFFLLICSLEVGLMLLLMLVFIFFHRKFKPEFPSALYFGMFFSLSLLLAIGFSVNNLGAIVRYRSIIQPLLMAPIIAMIDWNRLGRYLPGKSTISAQSEPFEKERRHTKE